METGNIIKMLRIKKGLTQDELGKILGVKKSAIQKYESGSIPNLKIEILRKICGHFNVPPWVLIFSKQINNIEEVLDFHADLKEYEMTMTAMTQLNSKGRERLRLVISDLLKIEEYTIKVQDKVQDEN